LSSGCPTKTTLGALGSAKVAWQEVQRQRWMQIV
jgi:hypothetical protein